MPRSAFSRSVVCNQHLVPLCCAVYHVVIKLTVCNGFVQTLRVNSDSRVHEVFERVLPLHVPLVKTLTFTR